MGEHEVERFKVIPPRPNRLPTNELYPRTRSPLHLFSGFLLFKQHCQSLISRNMPFPWMSVKLGCPAFYSTGGMWGPTQAFTDLIHDPSGPLQKPRPHLSWTLTELRGLTPPLCHSLVSELFPETGDRWLILLRRAWPGDIPGRGLVGSRSYQKALSPGIPKSELLGCSDLNERYLMTWLCV